MLDTSILQQVTEIFRNLEGNYTFRINYAPQREESNQLLAFLNDFASTSTHLNIEKQEVDGEILSFSLLKMEKIQESLSVVFRMDMNLLPCCWRFSMPMVRERICRMKALFQESAH